MDYFGVTMYNVVRMYNELSSDYVLFLLSIKCCVDVKFYYTSFRHWCQCTSYFGQFWIVWFQLLCVGSFVVPFCWCVRELGRNFCKVFHFWCEWGSQNDVGMDVKAYGLMQKVWRRLKVLSCCRILYKVTFFKKMTF